MNDLVIITAALTGYGPTKKIHPAVPCTPSEIVDASVECCEAGAAVVHIHVRDPLTGKPAFETHLFKEVLQNIRRKCDIIVNLTTSGFYPGGPEDIDERLGPVYLKPDMCSLDFGSVNRDDRVFVNSPKWVENALSCMRELNVKPEIEAYDIGHVAQAADFIGRKLVDSPPLIQFCMGVKWGIPATIDNLLLMRNTLPSQTIWGVLGLGSAQLPMITTSLLLGGNIRVGLEDNLFIRQGVMAKNNAEFVRMAVDLANRLERRPASPGEARTVLGI